jgi:DNA-directed RNA polymerase specialized sigma24 family protein
MTTAQTAFEAKVAQKINKMMPFLIKTANGDEDLIQEGAIGIWQSMAKKPDASDQYYANKARWNIQSVARGVGKSLDIPKWHHRKVPITIVHYDAIPDNADAELSQAILVNRKRVPLDEYVIQKVDFERFIDKLSRVEAKIVRLKVVDELADGKIADKLGKDLWQVKCLKKKLRDKIIDYFAG